MVTLLPGANHGVPAALKNAIEAELACNLEEAMSGASQDVSNLQHVCAFYSPTASTTRKRALPLIMRS